MCGSCFPTGKCGHSPSHSTSSLPAINKQGDGNTFAHFLWSVSSQGPQWPADCCQERSEIRPDRDGGDGPVLQGGSLEPQSAESRCVERDSLHGRRECPQLGPIEFYEAGSQCAERRSTHYLRRCRMARFFKL